MLLCFVSLLLWKPFEATDVAQLKPVEVIRVSTFAGGVLVETDTGDSGVGRDIERAIADLKQTTDGDVFLDTVDKLLISPAAVMLLSDLGDYLRPGCNVCVEMGQVELESVGAYLNIHEPGITLQDHRAGKTALPVLYVVDGRMYLDE
jgi:hypothetical protein